MYKHININMHKYTLGRHAYTYMLDIEAFTSHSRAHTDIHTNTCTHTQII